jgi:hypothetical protein
VDIDPSNTLCHELARLDEIENLLMIHDRSVRQGGQESQDLPPSCEAPAGKFANHERMGPYLTIQQATCQEGIASAQVIDPDGGIDEEH